MSLKMEGVVLYNMVLMAPMGNNTDFVLGLFGLLLLCNVLCNVWGFLKLHLVHKYCLRGP